MCPFFVLERFISFERSGVSRRNRGWYEAPLMHFPPRSVTGLKEYRLSWRWKDLYLFWFWKYRGITMPAKRTGSWTRKAFPSGSHEMICWKPYCSASFNTSRSLLGNQFLYLSSPRNLANDSLPLLVDKGTTGLCPNPKFRNVCIILTYPGFKRYTIADDE